MKEHRVATSAGNVVSYDSEGRGPPVVLVHGNSGSHRTYRHQLEGALGRACRLVTYDLPGHGASERAPSSHHYTLPGHAAILCEIAGALGVEDAVFGGWSMGGHVVLEAAGSLPGAKGFLIFGTPPVGRPPAMDSAFLPHPALPVAFRAESPPDEIQAFLSAWLRPGAQTPDVFLEDFARSDPAAREVIGASVGSLDYTDELEIVRSLTRPLAVLHGAEEQLVSRDYIADLEMPTLWRGAIHDVPDAGHAPQWENPAAFNELVAAFASDCER